MSLGVGAVLMCAGAASAQGRVRVGERVLHERACVKECRGDLNDCLRLAADDLSECTEPCADERAAARAACADDPTTDACKEARAALRGCVGPCLQVYDPAVEGCFGDARMCVADCPPVDDPPCVRACLEQRSSCLADLRAEAKTCRDRCRAETAAARRLCAGDPGSEECRAAAMAARVCLAPCGELVRKGLRECRQETRACLAECDDDSVTDSSAAR